MGRCLCLYFIVAATLTAAVLVRLTSVWVDYLPTDMDSYITFLYTAKLF